DSLDEFVKRMDELFAVEVRVTNKTISFKASNRKQSIRGKRLGDDYDKARIEERIKEAVLEREYSRKQKTQEQARVGKYPANIIENGKQELEEDNDKNILNQLEESVEKLNQALTSFDGKVDVTASMLDDITDSYITEDYPAAAIEAEKEAETEMRTYPKPKELSESIKEFMGIYPDMDREDFLDKFNAWYDEQWLLYEQQTVQREIKTKSR
ncbi:MAG: hypothetical protein Q4B70_15120, partial [Lachnospiraceae bacterium]|nr:hypothetical protein [Lachnospiraceae bacterium]